MPHVRFGPRVSKPETYSGRLLPVIHAFISEHCCLLNLNKNWQFLSTPEAGHGQYPCCAGEDLCAIPDSADTKLALITCMWYYRSLAGAIHLMLSIQIES